MARVPVETVLTARDVNTASTLRSLASMAGGLQQTVSMVHSAFGTFNALALGGGIALGAQSLIKVNQELENTTNQIAGNVKVFGFAKNYADSLLLADETLKRIRADAAALPGSDSDFIKAFSLTFPAQAELGVKSLEEMTKRSNELTAVLLSKGVDAQQAGRDISLMMRGHAGEDVRSFVELKSVMGVKSTEEWNRMAANKRLAKLDEARGKFGDAIKAFENTWDAVTSTGASYMKNLVTEGSKPLFELAKQNLKAINDYVSGIQPKLLTMASMLGTMAADATRVVGKETLGVLGGLRPRDYATSAVTSNLTSVVNNIASGALTLWASIKPLGEAIGAVGSAIVGVVGGLLPGLSVLGELALDVAGGIVETGAAIARYTADFFGPSLAQMATDVSSSTSVFVDLFLAGVGVLRPAFDALASGLNYVVDSLGKAYSYLNRFDFERLLKGGSFYQKETTSAVQAGSKSFFSEITDEAHKQAEETRKWLGFRRTDAVGATQQYMANFATEREKAEQARQARLAQIAKDAAKNKRPTINQDFRGSRFDIEQKFAPGFDPGRVLTALREDAGRMAQRRLSSGVGLPLFGQG